MQSDPRAFFTALFETAVAAADPRKVIQPFLPAKPRGRTIVVGAGKASSQMARALEETWQGPLEGVVVTRKGHAVPCVQVEVLEAGHPLPDEAGLRASQLLFQTVSGLSRDDLVIALMSGGGSALLPAPPSGMTLADETAVNRLLLSSGAPIAAMNMIRKQLSIIKGGRLAAAAHPAKVVTLVVSDVPRDDPALVASGPTVPDATTLNDALGVVEAYRLELPEVAMRHLRSGRATAPEPDDPRFDRDEVHVIASAAKSLEAAAAEAQRLGIEAVILSGSIEGEAKEVARMHAAIAAEIALYGRPFRRPVLLLSGGETTVTIHGPAGRGGRNGEFLLSLALGIDGMEGVHAFAADTDGIDGSEKNAGAFADYASVGRMRAAGLDPGVLLTRHDAWTAFHAIGDLFTSGPTGTNVNDFRAVLVR